MSNVSQRYDISLAGSNVAIALELFAAIVDKISYYSFHLITRGGGKVKYPIHSEKEAVQRWSLDIRVVSFDTYMFICDVIITLKNKYTGKLWLEQFTYGRACQRVNVF